MKSCALRSVLCLSALGGVAAAAEPVVPSGMASRLDAVIEQALHEKRIVGAVVMVAHQGKIVYQRGAGWADREARLPMEADTVFRLASMTKPLVTVATMRLVEEKKIALDDPVQRWLPTFRPALGNGERPPIALHQLLTHSAGLSYGIMEAPDGPYRTAGVSDGLDQPGLGLDENLRRIASVPLAYPPGTSWRYSVATDVLGGVLQKATGESLPDVVKRLVTGPLGMRDTAFTARQGARLAVPYADGVPEPLRMADQTKVPYGNGTIVFAPQRFLDPASFPSGGAGMLGTAPDFMRFLEALRQGGKPVLTPTSVARMMRPQIGADAQTQGPGWGFGYGWAVLEDASAAATPQSRGTIQWGGAYGHNWFVDPAQELSVVIMTNTAVEGMSGAFPQQIRDAVYGVPASANLVRKH